MQLTGLSNKVAFITGAGGGIGQALTRLLLNAGTEVIATDLNSDVLEELPSHSQCHKRLLDITDANSIALLIDQCKHEFGSLDFCVNVAGLASFNGIEESDIDLWDRIMNVNLRGVFLVSKAVAELMKVQRSGNIVTVSSNAAAIPRYKMSIYAASKAGATMFTRCLGLELAEFGIRCNIVAPGSTLTRMQTDMWQNGVDRDAVIAGAPEAFRTGIPLRKLAEPEDIAQAVIFLLSDQSNHVTMADLLVDGGATLRA